VTDYWDNRVVVKYPEHCFATTFSPDWNDANYLDHPSGIVAAPNGGIYVVNTSGRLIRIDRNTGAQSIVYEPGAGSPPPTDVGDQPWGIDFFADGPLHFYVSASDGLWLASEEPGGGFVGSLVDGTLPATHFGVGVRGGSAVIDSVWVAAGASGMWAWDASDDTAAQVLPSASGEWFLDVDFADGELGLPVFTRVEEAGFGGCAAGTGGVFTAFEGVSALSQGGLFRCPFSLAFVPEQGEIYVADVASILVGGEGRVVKLRQSGDTWEQSLFIDAAELGVSFPAGIAYVPEPDAAALGAIALAALAAASRAVSVSRRTRAGRQVGSASLP
jgi:DNA-binding beta-propeller fold protein YncE